MSNKYKNILWLLSFMILFYGGNFNYALTQDLPTKNHPKIEAYEGWKLACQTWTFKSLSFFETIDTLRSLGIHYVEAYNGQRLYEDDVKTKIRYKMKDKTIETILQKLNEAGIQWLNFGVVTPNSEKDWKSLFDFAKKVGIETIVSEPKRQHLTFVDELCNKYNIKIAIHNHPKPSVYWHPDSVLQVCQNLSKKVGVCADIGHWIRSGINPGDALEKLQDRLISLHFKDLNEFGVKSALDTIWGNGVGKSLQLFAQLDRVGFQGTISIEYEKNNPELVSDVRACIRNYGMMVSKLKPHSWEYLFNDALSNAKYNQGSWEIRDGILLRKGKGNIFSQEKYNNFILDFEFKVDKGTNSGVFLRTGNIDRYVQTSIEVQIHETSDGSKHGACGAIYDCMSPQKNAQKPAGEWNRYTITCLYNKIYVVLNGQAIIDMDMNDWTQANKNPDGSSNKFDTALKDFPRSGFIGFQDHGQPVWFRNIRIKRL